MTTTNKWIAMAERKPESGDYPIWCVNAGQLQKPFLVNKLADHAEQYFDHWTYVARPAEMPRNPVPSPDDTAMFAAWKLRWPTDADSPSCMTSDWRFGWKAALEWERKKAAILTEAMLAERGATAALETPEEFHIRMRRVAETANKPYAVDEHQI